VIEILLAAERAISFGQLDQAERLYRQVAEADPRNSIAVVGLARVALDRGEDDESLALAREALTIDPENEAARRLVLRLEEIREARGETVPVPAASRATGATAPAAPRPNAPAATTPPVATTPPARPAAAPAASAATAAHRRSLLDRLRGR
jgi:tetratricopeptide (TPR) repeat protein